MRLKHFYKSSLSFVDCTVRLVSCLHSWTLDYTCNRCLYPVWKKSEKLKPSYYTPHWPLSPVSSRSPRFASRATKLKLKTSFNPVIFALYCRTNSQQTNRIKLKTSFNPVILASYRLKAHRLLNLHREQPANDLIVCALQKFAEWAAIPRASRHGKSNS